MSSPLSQAAAAPGSAKAALSCACRVLGSHGIHLEAETLRLAKFNTPTVSTAMFQAVHDLVLLNVLWSSGLHIHSHTDPAVTLRAASHVWKEIKQEGTAGVTLDGLILVWYYLELWGCPRQIVQDLQQAAAAAAAAAAATDADADSAGAAHHMSSLSHEDMDAARFVGSRLCLLALAWLLQRCRLFETALQALHPSGSLRALLPPFPVDSCLCEATQQAYQQALDQAQAHSSKVLQLVQQTQAPHGSSSSQAEEQGWSCLEAAAHSATMLLGKARSSLSSLQSLLDCRLKLQQSVRQVQPAVGSSLSPLELHLLLNKKALQAHMQALCSEADALSQQQEIATCARLFYSWMSSVVAEEAKARGVTLGDPSASSGARPSAALSGLAALESLQRLPDCGSHVSASLLQHLDQQLQEAVEATQSWLSTSRTSEKLLVYQTKQPKTSDRDRVEDVNLAHFQRLASQALTAAVEPHPASQHVEGSSPAASCLPRGDWGFPADVTDCLQQMISLQAQAGASGSRPDVSDLIHTSACLKHEVPRAEDNVGQARPHPAGEQPRSSVLQADAVTQGAEEADRLLRSALQAGKALAQTRAANKQTMLLGLAQLPPEFRVHWPLT